MKDPFAFRLFACCESFFVARGRAEQVEREREGEQSEYRTCGGALVFGNGFKRFHAVILDISPAENGEDPKVEVEFVASNRISLV